METEAAKLISTALALIPLAFVGMALGRIFSSYNESVARNPNAAEILDKKFFLTFAFTEALAIFALVVSLLIFFLG